MLGSFTADNKNIFYMKKQFYKCLSLAAFFLTASLSAQTTQVVDLSTGVNASGAVLSYGSNEDTWTMFDPASNQWMVPKVCHLNSTWAQNDCSRWISPFTLGHVATESAPQQQYTYKMTFNITQCVVQNANIHFESVGADNRIISIIVNGNTIPVHTPILFNPLRTNLNFAVNAAWLHYGINTLSIVVQNNHNLSFNTYTGLNVCGDLTINFAPPVNLQLAGPNSVCAGSPVTFSGSLAPGSGTPTHYSWEIVESDINGNTIPGGFSWSQSLTGVPGSYTFPGNLNMPCNKYYRVKLMAGYGSACAIWSKVTRVFYYACPPGITEMANQTICEGECTTIGTFFPGKGISYSWSAGGVTFASGFQTEVCPEVTTTYTLTATNSYGCSSSRQVTVTVLPNNPRFNITTDVSHNDYYTVTATPVVLNAHVTQINFGYYWGVEEVGVFSVSNPSQWWTYPSANTFRGFDHYSNAYSGTVSIGSTTPANGRFLYNRTYRISRGTWNSNCEWNGFVYTLTGVKNAVTGLPEIRITESAAPEINTAVVSETAASADALNKITVFPNPGNGIFNVELHNQTDASLMISDLFGKQIQNRIIPAGTGSFTVDITGYAPGMYLLHITMNGETSTHKIILQ